MILPPALWDLPGDVVAVEIEGVTFLVTPDEATQLLAEGTARPVPSDAPIAETDERAERRGQRYRPPSARPPEWP